VIKAEAKALYKKLKNIWGVKTKTVEAKKTVGKYKPGFHPQAKTISCGAKTAVLMGELKPGYKRPSFKEYLQIYNIRLNKNRVTLDKR
jgi:hypothetical protein